MYIPSGRFHSTVVGVLFAVCRLFAQQSASNVPQTDSSKIGTDGTAYVTRVVPVRAPHASLE
jgi:hypothetical protein